MKNNQIDYWVWQSNFGKEEKKNILKTLSEKRIDLGQTTYSLEDKLKKYLNAKNVVAVSSGSAATLLAFMALNIKPGDEIIMPNLGWVNATNACKILGAKPVFVDVEKRRMTIDAKKIEEVITKKTKIIFTISLNGYFSDMKKIVEIAKKKNIFLVEDACHLIGLKKKGRYAGTFGDIGIFSMSMTKPLSSGQGGFLTIKKNILAKRVRDMRRHGYTGVKNVTKYDKHGFNFKITDVQSAIALASLEKLKRTQDTILNNYKYLVKKLNPLKKIMIPSAHLDFISEKPMYMEFLVFKKRNQLSRFLFKNRIENKFGPIGFHKTELFKIPKKKYPNSDELEETQLFLPSGPSITKKDLDRIIKTIFQFYQSV